MCTYYVLSLHTSGYFGQAELDKVMKESLKMKNFDHAHVMGLIGLCLDAGPTPYIVMPYMANGSLLQYLKRERKYLLLKKDADEDEVREKIFSLHPPLPLSICPLVYLSISLSTSDTRGLQASVSDVLPDC